jgi:hypothetical protein
VLATIRAYAETHPDLPWIVGSGWYMADFANGTPRREDLDAAVPDRPAYLPNRDGHSTWVNTRALELAGIDRETPDPPDGRIERDPDGTPAGTLHEGAPRNAERLLAGGRAERREASRIPGVPPLAPDLRLRDALSPARPVGHAAPPRQAGSPPGEGALWWERERGSSRSASRRAVARRNPAARSAEQREA